VWTANKLRGAFGRALMDLDRAAYERFFAPTIRSLTPASNLKTSPSGLRDLPRPFVFRLRQDEIAVHLFLLSAVDLVCRVMKKLSLECTESSPMRLDLPPPHDPGAAENLVNREPRRLRVRFLTPTGLKGAALADPLQPEFGVLLARIRDRISTLRAYYGPGPLDFDFRAFGERAARVRMTRCELQPVEEFRISKRTGQRHSIGGFTGFAEYEGFLDEFIPYLEAARWTGVGRHTVWGKGEISVEWIHECIDP